MAIKIRPARPEDYPAAETMLEQVQALHAAWRPDIYRPGARLFSPEDFSQAAGEGRMLVAEYDGQLAGVTVVLFRHVENPVQQTRNILFIDAMAVDEDFRGKGVGHAFFDFLRQMRTERGFDGIELQVSARNQAAYRMYRRYGFTEKSVTMELQEPPPEA